jgi:hypothetical protein
MSLQLLLVTFDLVDCHSIASLLLLPFSYFAYLIYDYKLKSNHFFFLDAGPPFFFFFFLVLLSMKFWKTSNFLLNNSSYYIASLSFIRKIMSAKSQQMIKWSIEEENR